MVFGGGGGGGAMGYYSEKQPYIVSSALSVGLSENLSERKRSRGGQKSFRRSIDLFSKHGLTWHWSDRN